MNEVPKPDLFSRIMAAKAALPAHDPMQDILNAMGGVVRALAASEARPLLAEEAARDLRTSIAGDCGRAVREASWSAMRTVEWRTAAVVGTVVAMALAGGVASGYWLGASAVRAEVRQTATVLGSMPAGDLVEWARVARLNPPPQAWSGKTVTASDGSAAVDVLLRTAPAPQKMATGGQR